MTEYDRGFADGAREKDALIRMASEKALDDVLEIVDKATSDFEAMPTEIDVGREKAVISFEKKDGMLAMASMIRVLVLALKGGEQE